MNYHVFIVDENTFKYHLEYSFAGTGAADKTSPFLLNSKTDKIHSTTERNLVGMIADISRIRVGDKIIFYLQALGSRQGMFFGVFKAKSLAFFDENDKNNYLKNKMVKGLSYRIMIEPDAVYLLGITEHEYLDSLIGKSKPYQMCWSLIYRKLKAARGCTMITEYEFTDLVDKLKAKNSAALTSDGLTYDCVKHCITSLTPKVYEGNTSIIDILPRLLYKSKKNNAFEVHLQAYLMQNFDKEPLRDLLLPFPSFDCWIGNEVSCGVGMQKIDVMIAQNIGENVYIKIVELKHVEPYKEIITTQIPWYIQWVSEYIAPNYTDVGKTVHIIPCVIARNSQNANYLKAVSDFNKNLHIKDNLKICKIQNIAFNITDNQILFKVIE